MATSPISSVTHQTSTDTYSTTSSTSSSDSTNDQFMTLLLAQLKNQDPMDPMDDSQLMTQLTSLNTLSTLQAMSKKIDTMASASQSSYAASLIGKTVVSTDDNGTSTEGVVTSMQLSGGVYTLTIGSQEVALDTITKVTQDSD
jgi:flagellar basal-body rod modification protein FlgD